MDSRDRAREVVAEIQALVNADAIPRAVDHTYNVLDALLLADSFLEAEEILMAIRASNLPIAVRLSALTISTPWRHRMRVAHEALRLSIRNQAYITGGQEKVDAVFKGIR